MSRGASGGKVAGTMPIMAPFSTGRQACVIA